MLYFDEVKFINIQLNGFFWGKKGMLKTRGELIKEITRKKVEVVSICSSEKMEGFMLVEGGVTHKEYCYFMYTFFNK